MDNVRGETMGNRRLVPVVLFAVFAIATSGCGLFHVYRPVTVLIRDADTKKPIKDAHVTIEYPPCMLGLFRPFPSSATTRADGIAHLLAAPHGGAYGGVAITSCAKGYDNPGHEWLSAEEIRKINPATLLTPWAWRPVTRIVEMYSGSSPTLELIIPDNYRGLIRVEYEPLDDDHCEPGKRRFTYVVPPSGVVHMKGPRFLKDFLPVELRAKYASGAVLESESKSPAEVVFHVLSIPDGMDYFVVGTEDECKKLRDNFAKRRAQGAESQR